ncbi:high choriolytic enzyme 1-like [Micropterus salmoides]|uniref:high choriolytic enzyme 1-like n=1 Tax=Micropterus salmoides TaxID=27706 RepID=UPI0018ED07EC|nr:high choriolytic enzyme 1-like [Micropterus salmoides]
MTPSASLLLLLLLGFSQAYPVQEEGSKVDVPDTVDMTTRILTSNSATNEILLEGDILAPTTRSAMICSSQSCRWKKATNGLVMVPYTVSSDFTSSEKQLINSSLNGFQAKTCIRFVPRQNEADYISIENQAGCFSSVGRVGGAQVLSLKRPNCLYYGVIQHEANHALGFQHEHTRTDRDSYVNINWENIDPQNAYNFAMQAANNLNTPYDYSSIMHYGKTAFSINWEDTMTPIPDPNVPIGQINGLSNWDIIRIKTFYGCL